MYLGHSRRRAWKRYAPAMELVNLRLYQGTFVSSFFLFFFFFFFFFFPFLLLLLPLLPLLLLYYSQAVN